MYLYLEQARQKVLRVPKGTSLYQAAWLSASEDEDEDDDEAIKISQDEDVLMNKMDQLELAFPYIPKPLENENENENEMEEPEDSWETLPLSMDKTEMNDLENDLDEHAQYLASRQLVQANNIQNDHDPSKKRDDEDEVVEDEEEEKVNDEVDTSPDVPARVRYQKYRGLNSFYTSPWDPHEQLPSLYGQIYQLPSFSMTRKRVLKSQVHAPIPLGTYVDIYVADVPKTNFESCVDELLWVTTLLPFEHQVGEMHFHIQLRGDPSRLYSKRPVLIQVGSRLFQVTPLLSEPKLGPNQCTKYIRTCGHRGQCILSTLMPMALHGPILP
ncbi:ribosome biogenesis protein tsr1 [Coelomomyces lativittatus]|nr:ribosome biogenesis protein tsr1 [Coelomomyces lativittatus]